MAALTSMQFVLHALVRCAAILADQMLIDNGGHEINQPLENIVLNRDLFDDPAFQRKFTNSK